MAFLTPLPTPPNSNKPKFEHSFSDDGQDNIETDSPLFESARSRRAASPTDAVLFPGRSTSAAPISPSSHAFSSPAFIAVSPKRQRINQEQEYVARSKQSVQHFQRPQADSRDLREVWQPPEFEENYADAPYHEYRGQKPSDEERHLVSSFHDQISTRFVDYGQERWFTLRHDPASNTWLQPQFTVSPPPPKRMFAPISSNVQKRKPHSSVVKSVEPARPHSPPLKRQIQTSRNPRQRSSHTPTNNGKSETRSTRNPANKPLVSKNYKDWPDYSPSEDNMHPDAVKFAKNIPQMSGSKDLSNDPLRDQLSEAELIAAQRAGMDCARYLCTKRSVFVGYVKHLRHHADKYQLSPEDIKKGLRSWNKTAAQGCSGIDVNKTSALWQHFWLPVGWFNKDLFQDVIEAEEVYFPRFDKDGGVVPQYDKNGKLMHP